MSITYNQSGRLQHLVANHAEGILSQDPVRTPIPRWNGTAWNNGSQQFVFSYPSYINFIINQFGSRIHVLFRNQNISIDSQSVCIYDDNGNLLWDSANYSDITELFPVVIGPLQWRTWSELSVSNLPVITSPNPIEQLHITNDQTIYLWYRRNITLTETKSYTTVHR